MITTREIADAYIALRADYNVAKAASRTMAEYSIIPQGLVDAFGAEILNTDRPDYQVIQNYRNEVLSHFAKLQNTSETD